MKKYPVLKENEDFFISKNLNGLKGSRVKNVAYMKYDIKKAMFKYEFDSDKLSEACSEKLSYEIAKILGYKCAHIELAQDMNGKKGVLNFLFTKENEQHFDASEFLNITGKSRKEFYTLDNIQKVLNGIDKKLFLKFIKIMVFDALVGETDRHEENWGLTLHNNKYYTISPLYDNGTNLLREFKNEMFSKEYFLNPPRKDFEKYIWKGKACIYTTDKQKYKLFDLVKELLKREPTIVKKELRNLKKLTPRRIIYIVNRIPSNYITTKHKEFIIKYLLRRKEILQNLLEEGTKNE